MNPFPFKSKLILASQSPRRKQLLTEAGYLFQVMAPADSVECGACSSQSPQGLVAESAFLKAKCIAAEFDSAVVLAADTVAECQGQILGKPVDQQHAEQMLRLMSGRTHSVFTGVTLWHRPSDCFLTKIEQTVLEMDELAEDQLQGFLESDEWVGKAGAFGYQDGLDWLHIRQGLASNVVGLPIERLPAWFDELQRQVSSDGLERSADH